jgi:hypothetical protein
MNRHPMEARAHATNSPPTNEAPKPIAFPHAKCLNCTTFLPIKRMSNHMVKCIGGGGRDSSRNALLKDAKRKFQWNRKPEWKYFAWQSAVHSDIEPCGTSRSSPIKRSADDDFDSDSPPQKKKKKVIKKTPVTTKLKVLPKTFQVDF